MDRNESKHVDGLQNMVFPFLSGFYISGLVGRNVTRCSEDSCGTAGRPALPSIMGVNKVKNSREVCP